MDKKFIIIISILIGLLILFVYPKSECGSDGPSGIYKCSCLGVIGEDPFEDDSLDNTIDYRCFGVKLGQTKLIEDKRAYELLECNMAICLLQTDISLKQDETYELKTGVFNDNSINNSFRLNIIKKGFLSKGGNIKNNSENIIYPEINFLTTQINLNPQEHKIITLKIKTHKEIQLGSYAFKLEVLDQDNKLKGTEEFFVTIE